MRRAATAARALTRQTFTAVRQVSAPHLAACTTASVRRSFSEGPPAPADEARLSETFLSGTAAQYLEELYLDWTEDPSSVHPSWNAYFKGLAAGAPPGAAHCKPGDAPVPTGGGGSEILSLQQLVRAYQHTGHSDADLDPLGVRQVPMRTRARAPRARCPSTAWQSRAHATGMSSERKPRIKQLTECARAVFLFWQADITLHDASGTQLESLNPATYGWSDADLTKSFNLGSSVSSGYLAAGELTLGEVMQKLKHTYTSKIGFEFMHLQSRSVVNWFRDRVERYPMYEMDVEKKKLILERLMDATLFEEFLATKYANDKRFGLEGCEALIPGMKALIDSSADYGVEAVVIGMPHRGRLNVLTQVMEKPMEALFSEFAGSNATDEGSGDVKYHLGTSIDRKTRNGKTVHMSLAANPSHLEAVNPVIAGKARAIAREKAKEATGSNFATQTAVCEHGLKAVMPICLHGDAAFAGQGVVYETMGMCELPCYANGGTVHVIVNNQIGFTTDPRFSRSTPYCCDLGKTYNAPIFHVNGDDPEAVVFVAELAAEWRATFQKDVIIDIVCYRRNGHNEQDQPSFTSPGMYEVISKHATGLDIYSDRLISEGVVTPEYVDQEKERINGVFEEAFVRSTSEGYQDESMWMESRWTKFKNAYEPGMPTGCDEETLKEVGIATTVMPEGFTLHKSLERIMKVRRKTVEQGAEMDFATAEAMAFGTLLKEGYHVRLSGQDVQRGTFSHRHALVHDQVSAAPPARPACLPACLPACFSRVPPAPAPRCMQAHMLDLSGL
jgi:2-oxoglutarate dehydrogenase E1 component